MARFNRINLDGVSRTVPGLLTAATLPGTMVQIDPSNSEFVTASTAGAATFVLNTSPLSTTADDLVPTGTTASMEIIESGRLLATLVAATSVLTLETPLKRVDGALEVVTLPADAALVVAYSTEALTVGASAELVCVRYK